MFDKERHMMEPIIVLIEYTTIQGTPPTQLASIPDLYIAYVKNAIDMILWSEAKNMGPIPNS